MAAHCPTPGCAGELSVRVTGNFTRVYPVEHLYNFADEDFDPDYVAEIYSYDHVDEDNETHDMELVCTNGCMHNLNEYDDWHDPENEPYEVLAVVDESFEN